VIEALLAKHGRRDVGLVAGTVLGGERRVVARGATGCDAIFEIGSITKVFTALLLARLAEAGTVSIDEPVLPGHAATLADLASHTAGFPHLPRGMLLSRSVDPDDPYATFGDAEMAAALETVKLKRPGKVRYSNFGGGLLGHRLAQRAGCGYGELVEREICRPLGLVDTHADVPSGKLNRFADGHNRRGKPVPHWHLDALAGAGVLRSTADDLLTFLEFQLAPPATPLGVAARRTQIMRAGHRRLEVGLGWMRSAGVLWHNGGTGGFRTFAGFAPERAAGVVVLSSSARSVDELGMELLQQLGA
jgi:CubicO group peptidase (beta-lactamase class C family)